MIEKLCCMSVTLAARFIGVLDLSMSILAINFIAGEFFMDEQRLIAFDEIKIFLGLNWAKTTMDTQQTFKHKWILICLMIYSVVHLICSAGLILATIFRKKAYAVPWLTFEVIGLANQASALAVHIFQNRRNHENVTNEASYVPVASLCLFLGVYFWIIVLVARKSWATGTSDSFLQLCDISEIESPMVNSKSSKAPSISNQDSSIFESPEPPIPSKYYEL